MIKYFIFSFMFSFCTIQAAGAASGDHLTLLLEKALEKNYAHAKIEIFEPIRWENGSAPTSVKTISIIEDDSHGNIRFIARDSFKKTEGWASFAAWVQAWVAVRRILPFEKLNSDSFSLNQINIACGPSRELSGLLLPQNLDISKLESTQTILVGQSLITPAVRNIPDIKRGEPVQVRLLSGMLILNTQGIAQETGYLSKPIRVMTQKGKRELLGMLKENGVVEVRL